MRNTISLAAAALALIAAPLAAATPSASAKPAATQSATGAQKMTPAQLANFQRAVRIMRLFSEAFRSDKVSNPVKGRLIACFYANDLAKISAATGQSLKKTAGLDEKKPADLYRAAAGVCGITFKKVEADQAAKGESGAKSTAKPASSGTTGR